MTEKYDLVGSKTCEKVLAENPGYKVFIRCGFAYRGATESEDDKQPHTEQMFRKQIVSTFDERMQRFYKWSAAIDIKVDHDTKEIHINGFSENDMY